MNTIVNASIGLILSSYCLVGTAVAAGRVKAKYALKSYIHPIGVLSVRERRPSHNSSLNLWEGVYRADSNYPKIKANLKKFGTKSAVDEFFEYGLSSAAVSVYRDQVEAAGIKAISSGIGMFEYKIKDRQGRVWSVIVRGDRDFHPIDSGEFTVVITTQYG
jgi:hypothetical protein